VCRCDLGRACRLDRGRVGRRRCAGRSRGNSNGTPYAAQAECNGGCCSAKPMGSTRHLPSRIWSERNRRERSVKPLRPMHQGSSLSSAKGQYGPLRTMPSFRHPERMCPVTPVDIARVAKRRRLLVANIAALEGYGERVTFPCWTRVPVSLQVANHPEAQRSDNLQRGTCSLCLAQLRNGRVIDPSTAVRRQERPGRRAARRWQLLRRLSRATARHDHWASRRRPARAEPCGPTASPCSLKY
jgi:hypothetical protein